MSLQYFHGCIKKSESRKKKSKKVTTFLRESRIISALCFARNRHEMRSRERKWPRLLLHWSNIEKLFWHEQQKEHTTMHKSDLFFARDRNNMSQKTRLFKVEKATARLHAQHEMFYEQTEDSWAEAVAPIWSAWYVIEAPNKIGLLIDSQIDLQRKVGYCSLKTFCTTVSRCNALEPKFGCYHQKNSTGVERFAAYFIFEETKRTNTDGTALTKWKSTANGKHVWNFYTWKAVIFT